MKVSWIGFVNSVTCGVLCLTCGLCTISAVYNTWKNKLSKNLITERKKKNLFKWGLADKSINKELLGDYRSAPGMPQNLENASVAAGKVDNSADAFLKILIYTRVFSQFVRWLETLSILCVCAFPYNDFVLMRIIFEVVNKYIPKWK